MNTIARYTLAGFVVLVSVSQLMAGVSARSDQSDLVKVYQVNRKVCDFPEGEDLSTPEAAYATIMRDYWATGASSAEWSKISTVKSNDTKRTSVSPEEAQNRRNAHIVEVVIYRDRLAEVIAQMTQGSVVGHDQRRLFLYKGRWLNAGQGFFAPTLQEARDLFARKCGRLYIKYEKRLGEGTESRWNRQPVADPQAHLEPFVQFLEDHAEDPIAFVMKALAEHKVSIIGEIHHRPRYWAFNSSLVADPEFPKHVGTIYMELPSHAQGLVDKFLSLEQYDPMPVIEMLREMFYMGWPDKPMLDFFKAVWNSNRKLPAEQRLRIILVDMERPWKKIRQRSDWGAYDVERDKYMAENIVRDMQSHPDEKRNSLFIVGVGHTALNFAFSGGYPSKTAGWYLRDKLGADAVYAIMQHHHVGTNMGRIDGRLCLGLFDSAFAKLDDKPIAFTLEQGPFGEQMYDGDPEEPVRSSFRDGFNGYLYLGPLETEIFSPLIEGFYTDEFVEELERRHKLMNGKGWAEAYRREKSDAENFINWMSGSWGKPRKWLNKLGPIDAWKYGDNWEEEYRKKEHKYALEHPEVIKTAAEKLFDAVRNADYEHHSDGSDWPNFLPETVDYYVYRSFDSWVQWICKTFRENPIESVELGEVSKDPNGLPAISYVVSLRDGRQLKGLLPFEYIPKQELWRGLYGIDWHLDPKWKDFPTTGEMP